MAAAASALYLDMFANVSYEIDLNGELRVLRVLSRLRPSCVFDVGANVGDWSLAAAATFPEAQLHAFEVIPEVARTMEDRVRAAGLSSVTVNAFGLSDHVGQMPIAYVPRFSAKSTAVGLSGQEEAEWRECPVQSGDNYCREHGIEHIDFLKLDVEGHEDRVLRGFEGTLADAKIDAVQFEYGRINASARVLLGVLYGLFEQHGYVVGKIYPDLVDFGAFDPWRDEDFRGPNYVAVHRAHGGLIRELAGN